MESNMKKKLVLPVIALALVGVTGSVYTFSHAGPTSVNAQTQPVVSNTPSQSSDKETADDGQKMQVQGENKPAYISSIQTTDTTEQSNEAVEQQQLAKLAKISSTQAKAAAEHALGGTASEVKLENDGGNVVYAVTVGSNDVKIDAGNGKILHTENSDREVPDGNSGE